jgi:hypothetical protein
MSSWNDWIKSTTELLIDGWGLHSDLAAKSALFLAYLFTYDLNPRITSGFRSPEKQAELQRRYEAGDPSVVYPPAKNSKHSNMRLGKPAALAIDISTNNPELAARIAVAVGIRAGYYFSTPDPVHFYL